MNDCYEGSDSSVSTWKLLILWMCVLNQVVVVEIDVAGNYLE